MVVSGHPTELDVAPDSWLWLAAIGLFGIGDAVSTAVGLGIDGVYEAGPVAAVVVAHSGLVGMFLVKAGLFVGFALLWRWTPGPHRLGIPLGLAGLGALVTGWNLAVVLAATLG